MVDKMRWRYGDTNLVVAAVDAATVIEIGDLVCQVDGRVKPMVAMDECVGWRCVGWWEVIERFLGVAMQRSRNGDTGNIRVATRGMFEFDLVLAPEAEIELGDCVGPMKRPLELDTPVSSQAIEIVPFSGLAIGRVARREPKAATSVLVDIRSRVMGYAI